MENHVVSSEENSAPLNEKSEKKIAKKVILVIVVLLFVIAVTIISYYFGSKSTNPEEISPTPTTFNEPSTTNSPTPTDTPVSETSATVKLTPTLSPTPASQTKILDSTAGLDGFRSSNNSGNNTLEVRTGRNANLVTRGFISFDINEIPSGATITEATLRLYLANSVGNPFGAGGQIKVDHLTYGDSLDASDYGMAALSSSFTTLTSNATKEWKDTNVTDRVKDDIANARSRSQFRIHFQVEATGGDVAGNFVYFEAAENSTGSGNTPQLVVKYY